MKKKIVIYNDEYSEMKKIEINGKIIEEGNYWDFDLDSTLSQVLDNLNISLIFKKYRFEENE